MMTHSDLKRLMIADWQAILNLLTRRQHLRPHQTLREVLQDTITELNCCPLAVRSAVQWLRTDAEQAIGRLRRTELIQLSRSIHRFWRRAAAEASGAS
ncbi:MAG: hypothetical protein ACREJC_15030 [Tepidisphaeraceae bacterium]